MRGGSPNDRFGLVRPPWQQREDHHARAAAVAIMAFRSPDPGFRWWRNDPVVPGSFTVHVIQTERNRRGKASVHLEGDATGQDIVEQRKVGEHEERKREVGRPSVKGQVGPERQHGGDDEQHCRQLHAGTPARPPYEESDQDQHRNADVAARLCRRWRPP